MLSNEISASELSRMFIKRALLVGHVVQYSRARLIRTRLTETLNFLGKTRILIGEIEGRGGGKGGGISRPTLRDMSEVKIGIQV